ncbi:Prolyl 4-hydroxylase subunit alpha-2 [Thelohanellus kitauei]|uniref:Prolyl 4-hydroxylase subunit alpha-2 n=1 Tax=Thelohanellus kitauei TaxID=669202 RepID=A0A0C2N1T3_THEKT|nr:Prolyl 4-hydroxylase subunit alpha-2 [Thelohanellus kitauei]
MIRSCVLTLILIAVSILPSNQEIFTSSVKICTLFHLELEELQLFDKKLLNQQYDDKISNLIGKISQEIPTDFITKKNLSKENCFDENSGISRFITNPINVVMLFKRFLDIWPQILRYSKFPQYYGIRKFLDKYGFDEEDLVGAYEGLYRLQNFYQLKPSDFKIGVFSESLKRLSVQWSTVPKFLSARDMLEVGVIAYQASDYKSTILWLKTALEDLNSKNDQLDDDSTIRLLDYLAWSEYLIGDFDAAFEHCHQILKIGIWTDNLRHFKKAKPKEKSSEDEEIESFTKSLNDEEFVKKLHKKLFNFSLEYLGDEDDNILSKHLCQVGHMLAPEKDEPLKPMCYVKKGTNSYGKFITANVEKILEDPGIFIFRSMATEQEILHFKSAVYDDMKTAVIVHPKTGKMETAKYRITQTYSLLNKSSWYNNQKDSIIKKMKAKISVASDLTLKSTEEFQVADYGIGGFYDAHYDFTRVIPL